MNSTLRYAAVGALAVAAGTSAQAPTPEPAQPGAHAPVLRYPSAFEGYRRLGDDAIGNWRAVNDRVREAAAMAAQTGRGVEPSPATGAAAPRPLGMPAPGGHSPRHGMPSPGGAK